jgi:tetratricopeptide (TPR) repeat protein
MLLVIDDIPQADKALHFNLGGPGCVHLAITRSIDIAVTVAREGLTVVPGLNRDDGLKFLARLAPEVVGADTEAARRLSETVGGLPYALILLGKYLRLHGGGRLDHLRESLELLLRDGGGPLAGYRRESPRTRLELFANTPPPLLAVVNIIEEGLDEPSSFAFHTLSVFPAKPNSFSEEAARAVSQSSVQNLRRLLDCGLLERESGGSGRYTMYQPIADYAAAQLNDNAAYQHVAEFFAQYVESHGTDYESLDQEMANILAAFRIAHERGMTRALIRGVNAFYHFLETRGLYALAKENLARAMEAAKSSNDTSGLMTTLLNLGRVAEKLGEYSQADDYLQEALALARLHGDRKMTSAALLPLGIVYSNRGKYEKAEEYLLEGLTLARDDDDLEKAGTLLTRLGIVAQNRENVKKAKEYNLEALDLGRRTQNPCIVVASLLNLGVAYRREDPQRAEGYLREGLVLARQIGDREKVGALHHALALVLRITEDYAGAERHLVEGLACANQIGHRWYSSIILIELGELRLRQQQLTAASAAFLEGLGIAEKADAHDLMAFALYGLARVEGRKGNIAEARRQGLASLTILESIDHGSLPDVRKWLEQLSD